ncbi:hypothetical protein, partial [Azospirillum brasilense]|uniref:hypothetical protein n=1 Tax=Azospirillum brasilense TaxID=192 RepID=UPI0012DEB048
MAHRTLSGLVATALTLAAVGAVGVTAGRAAAEQAVVVASTAPGYAQGQLVPDGTAVTVPDGANAMFLFANGRMLRVKGPFDGPLVGLDRRRQPCRWGALLPDRPRSRPRGRHPDAEGGGAGLHPRPWPGRNPMREV